MTVPVTGCSSGGSRKGSCAGGQTRRLIRCIRSPRNSCPCSSIMATLSSPALPKVGVSSRERVVSFKPQHASSLPPPRSSTAATATGRLSPHAHGAPGRPGSPRRLSHSGGMSSRDDLCAWAARWSQVTLGCLTRKGWAQQQNPASSLQELRRLQASCQSLARTEVA